MPVVVDAGLAVPAIDADWVESVVPLELGASCSLELASAPSQLHTSKSQLTLGSFLKPTGPRIGEVLPACSARDKQRAA